MRLLQRFTVAWILLAGVANLLAQPLHLPYRHYTVHDGLAQQQVRCMMQDSRGYLWVGTKAGISRFNGQRFENFRPAQGAPGDHVISLEEDGKGQVWASTHTGVGYYDGVQWHKVSGRREAQFIMAGEEAPLLLFPSSDTLWRASGDSLVFVGRTGAPLSGRHLQTTSATIPGQWVFHSDNPDSVLLARVNANGVVTGAEGVNLERYFYPITSGEGGMLLASKPNRRGVVYIRKPGEVQPFDSVRVSRGAAWERVSGMAYGLQGGLYLIADFKQAYYKPPDRVQAEQLDIPIDNPFRLMADREGAIWIYGEDGLYQYFPNGFSYISSRDAPATWSFGEDSRGNYWLGSFGHGLRRIHQGELSVYPFPEGFSASGRFYFGISEDHLGNLYFSHESGVLRLREGRFGWAVRGNPFFPGQSSAVLYNFFDARSQTVLIGMKGGVVIHHPGSGKNTDLFLEPLDGSFVLGAARDDKDNYWFTSGRKGICRYHIPTKELYSYKKGEEGVPLAGATCVENDPGHGLWFGASDGLFYYSEAAGRFSKIAQDIIPGPVNNLKVVDSLLMIGSLSGLHALHLPAFHLEGKEWLKAYNPNNGFLGIEPDQNGAYLDSRGRYWVACFNQVAMISKEKISMDGYPSRVRIFQVNGSRVPYSGEKPIVLPRGENQVTVRFEGIGFQRPLRTQFSWRLLGRTVEWSGWAEDKIAFFPQLPSGAYTFEVRSRHPGSLDSSGFITDSYSFQVQLPFFKEPHFYKFAFIAGLLLFALSGIGLAFYWNARQDARRARQAASEREQMMKYYQIQTLQSQLQPHFIFNLLNAIKSFIVRGRQAEAEEQIERLSKVMRRFLESSVGAGLEQHGEEKQKITLQSEIELLKYYIELMQVLKPDKFTFNIEVGPDVYPENVFIAPMVIQPFVENAIKHGLVPKKDGPGHLLIRFSRYMDGVRCIVQDNGPGFPFGLDRDWDRQPLQRSMGIGLVMSRVQLLRNFGVVVNIRIESPPQGGAVIYIYFAE